MLSAARGIVHAAYVYRTWLPCEGTIERSVDSRAAIQQVAADGGIALEADRFVVGAACFVTGAALREHIGPDRPIGLILRQAAFVREGVEDCECCGKAS